MDAWRQGAALELWQSLVHEAADQRGQALDEAQEAYLVFVLLRYQREQTLLARTQALAWLHAQQQVGQRRIDALRDVGDHCLLIAGLFPGVAQRRRVSEGYFIDLGRGAYAEVAQTERRGSADLFAQLAAGFAGLVGTLRAMRAMRGPAMELSLAVP
ncbi:hypothetical protein [Pseudoxanthomonas sp. GM95]|uniref:hypothetical protein n=1 Tax=Pseudoxanthomonas sp. GM95 TaxID=1881043 RepID=UPI0015871CD8|nr:hypothetical protein [Pseudoxanthomonas sp. GM95]